MTPRPGSVATPNGDVYRWKALLDKVLRCVNGVNVVYQTVYKPQYTPDGDTKAVLVVAFSLTHRVNKNESRDFGRLTKLEALPTTFANSMNLNRKIKNRR